MRTVDILWALIVGNSRGGYNKSEIIENTWPDPNDEPMASYDLIRNVISRYRPAFLAIGLLITYAYKNGGRYEITTIEGTLNEVSNSVAVVGQETTLPDGHSA